MKSLISFLLAVESILVLMMIMISVNYDAAIPVKADDLVKHACRGGDFKKNSIIEKNRASAFDQILKTGNNANNNGFYHTQVGDKPEDQVSAVLFCPPNIPGEICKCCFRNLVPALLSNCSTQKGRRSVGHLLLLRLYGALLRRS
ncbi:hypothetical protein R6Q57_027728 [Mikania cordata]